jgi:hypothetical protein
MIALFVAIIAVVVLAVVLVDIWKKGPAEIATIDLQTQMRNQAISQLRPIQPATLAQIQDAAEQLSNQKPMTTVQRTQALNQAVSQLKAQ